MGVETVDDVVVKPFAEDVAIGRVEVTFLSIEVGLELADDDRPWFR